ncbi:MAG: type III pantothenate kinase [Ignavibacteria bacterium]|nr:type III pantothenate kinase [Ignavibacteria bacterium]
MNLVIDIGNSTIKAGIAKTRLIKNSVKVNFYGKEKFSKDLEIFLKSFTVKNKVREFESAGVSLVDFKLRKDCRRIIKNYSVTEPLFISPEINLPIKIKYSRTLGSDRICSAVAADSRFTGKNILVIDFGTATTYNIISKSTYKGGIISPGIKTALNSLITNTALPYPEKTGIYKLISRDTSSAISSGVFLGVKYTTEGIIKTLKNKYNNLTVIATGGISDSIKNLIKGINYFEKHLVLEGIVMILEHNKNCTKIKKNIK